MRGMRRAKRAGSAALLSLLLIAPAAAQSVTWRAATEYPATAMPGEGLATFAREVDEKTGHAVQVIPEFDAPDGLTSAAIPAAVQAGRIAVGDAFSGALAGIDPVFALSSLPFVATSAEQARALYDAARPFYAAAFARLGQVLLYSTPWPPSGIWSRRPVTAPEDLAHLKIRTYDATSSAVFRRAGANAVNISFADTMAQLRDGRIDAVLSSGDGGAGRKLWEFTPSFTAIGYAMPLSFATVSDTALGALDPEVRREVLAAAAETEALQWHALIGRQENNADVMRLNRVTILAPSPALSALLKTAAQAPVAEWVARAGPAAARSLEAVR